MHNFKELIVWQKARNLVKDIYHSSRSFPEEEKFGLVSQMRRAAVSIPSNIAEGAGRGSNKEFVRFLDIACGSAFELETQLILCLDLDFLPEAEFRNLEVKVQEIQRMIFSLKNKYQVS